eukprot:2434425-Pyramimonas_sp.AAC.1
MGELNCRVTRWRLDKVLTVNCAGTVADLTLFFQGKESAQFGKWWHDMEASERRKMIVKARNLLWTVSV